MELSLELWKHFIMELKKLILSEGIQILKLKLLIEINIAFKHD